MQIQWHLFPLELIAMILAFVGYRKAGIFLMIITLVLTLISFKTHLTNPLTIVL